MATRIIVRPIGTRKSSVRGGPQTHQRQAMREASQRFIDSLDADAAACVIAMLTARDTSALADFCESRGVARGVARCLCLDASEAFLASLEESERVAVGGLLRDGLRSIVADMCEEKGYTRSTATFVAV